MPAEERQFYTDTILKKSITNSTMSSSASSQSGSLHPAASPTGDHMITSNHMTPSPIQVTPDGDHEFKSEVNTSIPSASRGVKQNGTREVYHVTFAESPTEHVASDSCHGDTVIHSDNNVQYHAMNGHGGQGDMDILSSHNQTYSKPTASLSGSISPTGQTAPLTPIIKLQRSASTESHENPFLADGELSKKAEYIVKHSTISRTEIRIDDPDQKALSQPVDEVDAIQKTEVTSVQATPNRPNDIGVTDQNGKVEDAITPTSVEVVEKANASQPEPEQAEQVKLKDDKKCKCCTIM